MPRYWKVLNADGSSCHGGTFTYDLPKNGKPGAWTPRINNIEPCRRGYHVCRDADLVHWCNGAAIYALEIHPSARTIWQDDKGVTTGPVRLIAPTPWDAVTARLFAVECAADVLHLNDDPRVSDCLVTAYRYALGEATEEERAAAREAAREAAGAAAWATAGATQTARLLWWLGASPEYPQP